MGAIALSALCTMLVLAPGASAAKKPYAYNVKLNFNQSRPWDYHHTLDTEPGITPSCSRTDEGSGLDSVKVKGTALLNITPGGVAGFFMKGRHTRTGQMTHTVTGAECAPAAVFPSTWSQDTTVAGTVTATEPADHCGAKHPNANFPTLELAGSHLVLEWDSNPTPDFKDCPYFDGVSEASPGHRLPGDAYRDVVIRLPRKQLHAGKHKIEASGTSSKSANENCANLVQHCDADTTYDATASVDAEAKVVMTRVKH